VFGDIQIIRGTQRGDRFDKVSRKPILLFKTLVFNALRSKKSCLLQFPTFWLYKILSFIFNLIFKAYKPYKTAKCHTFLAWGEKRRKGFLVVI
jgi:hypothetical protein